MKTKFKITGILILFIFIIFGCEQNKYISKNSGNLIPIKSITHAHGIAVDANNQSKLYIATHHGLLTLVNGKNLYQIWESKNDYMGFSPHPTNAKVFFASGHPESGGNIGFWKSEDGGYSWRQISLGANGPVDFHAMGVSPVNPNIIYGYYQGDLQISTDGGKDWKIVYSKLPLVVSIAADTKNEDIVYAATIEGLMVSKDKGKTWDYASDDLKGFITLSSIAINPRDSKKMLSYSGKIGLAKSIDSGKTWQKTNSNFNEESPLYLSFDNTDPDIVYAVTEKNSIFKSMDSGNSWKKFY